MEQVAKYMPGQEPTEETAEEYQARIAKLVSEVAAIMEFVGPETLDQWECEQWLTSARRVPLPPLEKITEI